MNRFIAFTVLALAALAVAHSHPHPRDDEFNEASTQASLTTSPAEETAQLAEKNLQAFAPYCISARDYIYDDLRTKAGTTSSKGFSYFFSMADDVAKKALEVNQDATSRLGNQLAEPNAEVEGDDEIAQAQRKVATQNQPQALLTAFTGAMKATANAIISVLQEKTAQMKEFAEPRVFLDIAKYGCSQALEYEEQVRKMFNEFKQQVPAEHKAQVENVRIEMVPCVTVKRISRVNGLCGLINNSYAPFLKLLGLSQKTE